MKMIIYTVLLCLPLSLVAQENTDNLDLANKILEVNEKNILRISKETTEKAFTNYTLNSGEHINYSYGWHIKEINGVPTREHGGLIFGFKSTGVYLPNYDIYVVRLKNCDCNSPTKITREIAELAAKH